MIPAIHADRWAAFIAQHPDPDKLIEQQRGDIFRCSWISPPKTVEEHQWLIMLWQMDVMNDARWNGLNPPQPKPIVPGDPALFRF